MAADNMTLEEQKEVAINRYVDLMRIKAHETGENQSCKSKTFKFWH